jgi:hypothetical protein
MSPCPPRMLPSAWCFWPSEGFVFERCVISRSLTLCGSQRPTGRRRVWPGGESAHPSPVSWTQSLAHHDPSPVRGALTSDPHPPGSVTPPFTSSSMLASHLLHTQPTSPQTLTVPVAWGANHFPPASPRTHSGGVKPQPLGSTCVTLQGACLVDRQM